MKYICTICASVYEEEELTENNTCPSGQSHSLYRIEEACDMVNAYVKELPEYDNE